MADFAEERVTWAKQRLAEMHARKPVEGYEAKQRRLDKARERAKLRDQQRVDHLVHGLPRPKPDLAKPKGMSRQEWKVEKERQRQAGARLEPGIEQPVAIRERWGDAHGTPETRERAAHTHQGSIAQLYANGTITSEQRASAEEIAQAAERIEGDVTIRVASLEARVDGGSSDRRFFETLAQARQAVTYTRWRTALPLSDRPAVLDMLTGEQVGYSVAAKRHGMDHRRAKRMLLAALDLWVECKAVTHRDVDDDALRVAHAACA